MVLQVVAQLWTASSGSCDADGIPAACGSSLGMDVDLSGAAFAFVLGATSSCSPEQYCGGRRFTSISEHVNL